MHPRVVEVVGYLLAKAQRFSLAVARYSGFCAAGFAATSAFGEPIGRTESPASIGTLERAGSLEPSSSVVRSAVTSGETYGYGLGGWGEGWTNGWWIADSGGAVTTFEGAGPKPVTPSVFGAVGDQMELSEQVTSFAGGSSLLQIDILARDSDGNLTNWFVDGSTAAAGVPFSIAEFDLADFGAPEDKLGFGDGTDSYELQSAEYWFVGTGGSLFGPGGEPFEWQDTSTTGGISGYASVTIDGDLSSFTVGGEEFAGFAMRFSISPTAVPEPSSVSLAAVVAVLAAVRFRL